MRDAPPDLLPIFRSRLQARLLTGLFLAPGQEFTITELAERLGSPLPTVQREVTRLVKAGLLAERRVGRARVIRADTTTTVAGSLARLLEVGFGPPAVIAEEFAGVAGVHELLIFGSWAARHEGDPGPPPNDIDLLVVGSPSRGEVYDAAERAEQRLGISVNVVLRTVSAWEGDGDGLLREIKSGHVVPVTVGKDAHGP